MQARNHDVTSFFNKLFLIWQETDLCRELVWSSPSDGLHYSIIGGSDWIYDFLAGLNPKFDVVRGMILGQRSILSLMKVYFEIRVEEDCTRSMSILATPTTDFVAFSARSFTSGSEKHNGKPVSVSEHWKKQ